MKKISVISLPFLLSTFLYNFSNAQEIIGVPRIIDGDTVHINNYKIRLEGIDAPEIKQRCTKDGKKWSCGLESTKFLRDLIGNNRIKCDTNGQDRYNRYIGVCYKNNIDINSEMVVHGWAIAYKYYSLDYIKEEEIAKSKKAGIWIGEFEEPYLFRKKNK